MEYKRYCRTRQVGKERAAAEIGKQGIKYAGFRQLINGTGHVEQTREQNTESDQDIAKRLGVFIFLPHEQNDAGNQGNRCEAGGLEDLKPSGSSVKIEKTNNLTGNRGTDIGSDNYSKRLAQCNDACTDKAGRNHNRCGTGLNNGGHGNTKQECLNWIIGDMFHCDFQGAGRTFLQAISHQPHSIQKHCQSAEQRQQIKYIHKILFTRCRKQPNFIMNKQVRRMLEKHYAVIFWWSEVDSYPK